jgi:hypothetical protein
VEKRKGKIIEEGGGRGEDGTVKGVVGREEGDKEGQGEGKVVEGGVGEGRVVEVG